MPSPFLIARTVSAPRAQVWAAFSEQDQLQRWFGPKGMTMPHASLDLRVGGTFHFQLLAPNGMEMWAKWTFLEIVPEAKLHFVSAFSDRDGGLGHHPMAPDWPQKTLSTFTFANDSLTDTTVTSQSVAYEASAKGQAAFDAGHDSMRMGWTGTFDRLEAYLAAA
jgi:uncharacterized protein YndB with AHSA1/START domain